MTPHDVVAAWLAGLDHVIRCKGCEICRVPEGVPPSEEKAAEETADDDTPLDESVKPNYDSPFKKPWGGGRPK